MHIAAPDPFHLQKLCLFLAFSKCVAPKRPRIADILTLYCWWFWSERETCLVFVEQSVKTHSFAQVQWCISELSWKCFYRAPKLFFFPHGCACPHGGRSKRIHIVSQDERLFQISSSKKKKERRWEYMYAAVCINIFGIILLSTSWLCGKKNKNVYVHVKRQWNYRWFIEIWQFW